MSTFTGVRCVDLRFPTSRDLHGSDALNRAPDYSAAYVILSTDAADRHEGHGFVFTIGLGNDVQVAAIQALSPYLVGRTVEGVLADLGAFSRELVHDSQLRWLGPEKGPVHMAIGAVLNALWDLRAKRAGLPLWQLLCRLETDELVSLVDFRYLSDLLTEADARRILDRGSARRQEREESLLADGYPAYTTSAGWLGYSDAQVLSLVSEAIGAGFRHIKIKVGADLDADLRRLSAVRALVGPDVRIAVDANQVWDVPDAIRAIEAMRPYDPWWVEEPTSPDDVLGYLDIRRAVSPTRIAAGEHAANRVVFKQLLRGGVDFAQIDATRVAGVNENIAVLLLAAKTGTPVCPHAGGVGLCELVQHLSFFDYVAVSQSWDNRAIEFVDHLHDHFVTPVTVSSGRYLPPSTPGSGAQIRPATLTRFQFPSGAEWSGPPAPPQRRDEAREPISTSESL